MYVLYLDVLFFINWIMNSMVFLIATLMLNEPLQLRRLGLAGGMAAALYCLVVSVPFLQDIPALVYTLILPSLSILYLYKPRHITIFIKRWLLCQGLAFLLGGTTFSLWYMLGYKGNFEEISILYLLGIAGSVTLVIYMSFYSIRKHWILPHFEYRVKMLHQGRIGEFQAVVDTGNMLYTPFKHQAVSVVTYAAIESLLTEEEYLFVKNYMGQKNWEELEQIPKGITLIPFNSVGCKSGFLIGIEMEEIYVYRHNKRQDFKRCIVGISPTSFFSDKAYNTLLHPEFIVDKGE
ncbi:hypothetical protein CS063_07125 [Sporanaerobium hydrogeniformans]|uniref:Uncharacterized protein n=1 Tax=Sporanaerobium hydrogeniformans TaxID=3072179 RepID=A0AC61DE04_9FIRM|nr:sigma-E processing peptidase SpoIIGA [Sporanaerobium hydrogeniformans]PHV71095.1 hypothetical protein CS063_07125 [Sporanaerobium hydrogeniformans]